jgi:type IX secretion system PorP/SprF family membrane protein
MIVRLKNSLILVLIFFSIQNAILAQQEPMYTQNNFDRLVFNPAYAGSSGWILNTFKHRTQFTGVEGAPQTQMLTIHAPWQAKSVGFGSKVINDHLGATNQLMVSGIGSYHLWIGDGRLSVGLELGFFSQTIDFAQLHRVNQNDNALPTAKQSVFRPDGAFGLQYQSVNRKKKTEYFLGFSIQHLFKSDLNFTDFDRSNVAELSRHYFFSGGYAFDYKSGFSLQPCFLIKKVKGIPMQTDLYVNFIYQEKYTLGIGYRTRDALTFVVKYNITDAIRFSYSYDMRTSQVATYSSAAHEIMLRYGIKLLPPQQMKEIDPRFYF